MNHRQREKNRNTAAALHRIVVARRPMKVIQAPRDSGKSYWPHLVGVRPNVPGDAAAASALEQVLNVELARHDDVVDAMTYFAWFTSPPVVIDPRSVVLMNCIA